MTAKELRGPGIRMDLGIQDQHGVNVAVDHWAEVHGNARRSHGGHAPPSRVAQLIWTSG